MQARTPKDKSRGYCHFEAKPECLIRSFATRRAMTLIELLVAASVTVILLAGLLPMIGASVRAWHRNVIDTSTTMDMSLAMRRIASELRYAKAVNINANGTSIQYTLPDATSATFSLNNGNLMWSWSANGAPLLRGIVTNDPQFGGTYRLFEMSFVSDNSRAVLVRLCVRVNTPVGVRTQRLQQMVVLRN